MKQGSFYEYNCGQKSLKLPVSFRIPSRSLVVCCKVVDEYEI